MPRHRSRATYASGNASTSRLFINTRGQPTLDIAICRRCQTKRMRSELVEDGNINKFFVCNPRISPGCWDTYDPMRLPAPPPDDIRVQYPAPDTDITIYPDGLPPLEPPPQED